MAPAASAPRAALPVVAPPSPQKQLQPLRARHVSPPPAHRGTLPRSPPCSHPRPSSIASWSAGGRWRRPVRSATRVGRHRADSSCRGTAFGGAVRARSGSRRRQRRRRHVPAQLAAGDAGGCGGRAVGARRFGPALVGVHPADHAGRPAGAAALLHVAGPHGADEAALVAAHPHIRPQGSAQGLHADWPLRAWQARTDVVACCEVTCLGASGMHWMSAPAGAQHVHGVQGGKGAHGQAARRGLAAIAAVPGVRKGAGGDWRAKDGNGNT